MEQGIPERMVTMAVYKPMVRTEKINNAIINIKC